MNILDTIVAFKKKELEEKKKTATVQSLESQGLHSAKLSLVNNLAADNSSGIIAEFKRKSPSKGWFKQPDFAAPPTAKAYEEHGAAAISVLTDGEFFGGANADLVEVKKAVSLPVLRKDFIIDRWQVAESHAIGADVILLIAACLTKEEVKELAVYALSLGLEVLLEIHHEKELGHICEEVSLVGVNNRDLETFEVRLETSYRLIKEIGQQPAVSESGIHDCETIHALRQAGFQGFLIGERFMKENDPGNAFKEFVNHLNFPPPKGEARRGQ